MPEGLLLSGRKSFATAARVADRIVGFPLHPGTGHRLLVELDTSRPELVFLEDWDMLGQRLTASNGLTLDRYLVRAGGRAGRPRAATTTRARRRAASRSSPSS